MLKKCAKCGKELLPGNNFCVNCGLKTESAENEYDLGATSIEPPRKEDGKAETNWFGYFIIIAIAILFLKTVIGKMETATPSVPSPTSALSSTPIPIVSLENFSCLTNPEYLAAPETFTVDKENEIPAGVPYIYTFPLHPTREESLQKYFWEKASQEIQGNSYQTPSPAWVEDVLDENTIKLSYTATLNGQKFLTFAAVSLYGLGDISDECQKKETIAFLKSTLKGRFVYLSAMFGDSGKTEFRKDSEKFKQFTGEYPIMSKRLSVMNVHLILEGSKNAPVGLYLADMDSSLTILPDIKAEALRQEALHFWLQSSTLPFLGRDIDVSKSIIASGYGTPATVITIEAHPPDYISSFRFSSEKTTYPALNDSYLGLEMLTAKAAKRGLYGGNTACTPIN